MMLLITVYLGLKFNVPFGGLVKVSPTAFKNIGNTLRQLPQQSFDLSADTKNTASNPDIVSFPMRQTVIK
jgi:hypothetical protein